MVASAPLDFWRYDLLAQGIANRRCYNCLGNWDNNEMMQRFGCVLLEDVKKAAEKRSDKRKKTLFGLNAPCDDIRRLMQQQSTATARARFRLFFCSARPIRQSTYAHFNLLCISADSKTRQAQKRDWRVTSHLIQSEQKLKDAA
ncbi:hypothetical protein V8J88_07690 [Massilia sp. W12]|uniref:hypothetical protein n=1 Tax=Massilia sp. W12 TaxID=3126507 RepID=UPI0030D1E24B